MLVDRRLIGHETRRKREAAILAIDVAMLFGESPIQAEERKYQQSREERTGGTLAGSAGTDQTNQHV
jgi:hypothetical protein